MTFKNFPSKFSFAIGYVIAIAFFLCAGSYAQAMSYAECSAKGCTCQSSGTGSGTEEYWCQPGTEPAPVPALAPRPGGQSCESKCNNGSEGTIAECQRRCKGTAAAPAEQQAAQPATPSPEELAQQCINQSQAAIGACDSANQSATNTCDSDQNSSLSGAASNATLALGQTTGSSVQAACSNMGGVSQGANAGLAAYRTQCRSGKESCTSACASAKNAMDQCANQSSDPSAVKSAMQGMGEYQQVTSNNSSCVALQTKLDEADQAINNYAKTMANSQDCANATSGMDPSMDASQAGDPNSAYCQAHPTIASCVVDCSKPSMASNPTCSYLKNPYANGGVNLEKSTGLTASGGGYQAPAANGAADLKLGGDPAWMGTADLADRIAQAHSATGEALGGKQGNGANVGGGPGGPGGAPAKKGGPVLDDGPNGAGGSGFYASGGAGGGGAAYAAAVAARERYLAANGGAQKNQGLPDLRQFLPGGRMDPRRTIAGMSGPDGITGPNSNIWQKVQNRYRTMSNTLLP